MNVRKSHLRLALIALGVAVLYNLWYFVLRPSPRPAGRATPEQPLIAEPAIAPGTPIALDPAAIPAPPDIDTSASPSWRRDPFLFGDETRSVTVPTVRPPAAPEPMVRSILFSADRRLAIVDGRIVGIGESIGGYTVSEIEQGAVVFTAPSGRRLRVSVHDGSPKGPAR